MSLRRIRKCLLITTEGLGTHQDPCREVHAVVDPETFEILGAIDTWKNKGSMRNEPADPDRTA